MRSHDLAWNGCLNVRDLGGHPTRDGGETAFGAIVRADSVRQLTAEGWRALLDYGIRTIVDLRGDHERADDPPHDVPVEVIHVPFTADYADWWHNLRPEFNRVTDRRDVYLVVLEMFSRSVGESFRAVARAPDGGVVIHCVGGKDRTGLLAALVLHLAGVDTYEIAADYAVSEKRLHAREVDWLARAQTEEERAQIREASRTPASAMVRVLEELERRHGSVEEYLRGSGAADEDFARIRARLSG
jgi:protein tyrosine/serine phosphatase